MTRGGGPANMILTIHRLTRDGLCYKEVVQYPSDWHEVDTILDRVSALHNLRITGVTVGNKHRLGAIPRIVHGQRTMCTWGKS